MRSRVAPRCHTSRRSPCTRCCSARPGWRSGKLLDAWGVEARYVAALNALVDLDGSPAILERAGRELAGGGKEVEHALANLAALVGAVHARRPDLDLHVDLAELRGYRYHTGFVFAAFVPGYGREVARGGRYDEIGSVFGRARAATGFSADLKTLIDLQTLGSDASDPGRGHRAMVGRPRVARRHSGAQIGREAGGPALAG